MGMGQKRVKTLSSLFAQITYFFLLSSFFSIVLSKLKLKFQKDLTPQHQKRSIGTKGYESNLQKQHHVPLLSLLSSSPITLLESPRVVVKEEAERLVLKSFVLLKGKKHVLMDLDRRDSGKEARFVFGVIITT
jgi:hypothetical protein